jgi:hypothetical protein
MGDPDLRGPVTRRGLVLAAITAVGLAVWLLLSVANAPLKTAPAPWGIVSLELAGTAERATAIVASWGPKQREAAAFGLGLDFLFLFLYPIAISLALRITAERVAPVRPGWGRVGRTLSLMVPVATALDAVENVALWRILQLGAADAVVAVATGAAAIKFGLVILGLGCAALCWALAPPRRAPI